MIPAYHQVIVCVQKSKLLLTRLHTFFRTSNEFVSREAENPYQQPLQITLVVRNLVPTSTALLPVKTVAMATAMQHNK
jgi:hypothetical protein